MFLQHSCTISCSFSFPSSIPAAGVLVSVCLCLISAPLSTTVLVVPVLLLPSISISISRVWREEWRDCSSRRLWREEEDKRWRRSGERESLEGKLKEGK